MHVIPLCWDKIVVHTLERVIYECFTNSVLFVFIFCTGGIKEFSRYYPELCDSYNNKKDLNIGSTMPLTSSHPPSFLLPCSPLPPLSPSIVSTPNCSIDRFENEPPTKVLPYLYVGNAKDSTNAKLLRELGISYILSVTTNSPFSTSTSSSTASSSPFSSNNNNHLHSSNNDHQSEFRKMQIPVSDNLCENLAPYFDAAYEFIGKLDMQLFLPFQLFPNALNQFMKSSSISIFC